MEQKIMEFQKFLEREIEADIDKALKSGSLSPADICILKDAFKLIKLIGEYEDKGYSSRRGRSRTTGRYMSRDSFGSYEGGSNRSYGSYEGGSNDGSYGRGSYERSGHTQLISELERMFDKAQNERERQMIGEWISRVEQG